MVYANYSQLRLIMGSTYKKLS